MLSQSAHCFYFSLLFREYLYSGELPVGETAIRLAGLCKTAKRTMAAC